MHFPLLHDIVTDAATLAGEIAALAEGAGSSGAQKAVVDSLAAGRSAILLGGAAMRHSAFAQIRAAATALAAKTGAVLGFLPEGGNAAGTALAGALPHRLPGGQPDPSPGLDVARMLEAPLAACVLLGGIEPARDIGVAGAQETLAGCPRVVAITPYADPDVMAVSQVLLPMGSFAETSGTYVNVEGRWQEFRGCAQPVGESRPGWKILRVLGNQLGLDGFDHSSSADVLAELRALAGDARYDGRMTPSNPRQPGGRGDTTLVPLYGSDALVRRAPALQKTRTALAGSSGATA
jgi:NADH-quinone oxidoreductase subunit G